jgi:tRNA 2-thiouridine synthesizing protein A
MANQILDAKGLNCPLPILKAKKALKDVPTFCRTTGNELVESTEASGVYRFLIKRVI